MPRVTLGLIIIFIAAMIAKGLGPIIWAISSMLGLALVLWGINVYVQKNTNPD